MESAAKVDISAPRHILFTNAICPFAERAAIALKEIGPPLQSQVMPFVMGLQSLKPAWYKDQIFEGATVPAVLTLKDPNSAYKMVETLQGSLGANNKDKDASTLDGVTVGESMDVVRYLAEVAGQVSLFYAEPGSAEAQRQQTAVQHISDEIVSFSYGLLFAKKAERPALVEKVSMAYRKLEEMYAASNSAPFFGGSKLSVVDLAAMPMCYRFQFTLAHYRDTVVVSDSKTPRLRAALCAWVARDSVKSTTVSGDTLVRVYAGYAKKGDEEEDDGEKNN